MPRRHLKEVKSHTHTLEWHSACNRACVAEDHAAPLERFPTEEAASHTYICCLSICLRSPVSPRLRGSLPSLSSLGGGYQSERGKENSYEYECTAACGHWGLLYPARLGRVEIDCPEKQ